MTAVIGRILQALPQGTQALQARDTILVFLIQCSGVLAAYGLQVLFARLLGTAGYGVFAYAYSWTLILSVFSIVGMDRMTLRFVSDYKTNRQWGMVRGVVEMGRWSVLLSGIAFAVLGSLVVAGVADLWGGEGLVLMLAMWLVPFFAISLVQVSLLQAFRDVGWAFLPERLLRPLLAIVGGLALARFAGPLTPSKAMAAMLIAAAVVTVINRARIIRVLPVKVRASEVAYQRRLWIGMALASLLVSAGSVILTRVDVVMVGALRGATDAGLYNAAARTAQVLQLAAFAANAIAAPIFASAQATRDQGGLQKAAALASHLTFWPALSGLVVLLFAGQFLLAMFGSDFVAVHTELVILSGAYVFSAAAGSVGYLLAMTGHHRIVAAVSITIALGNIALNFWLIPLLGLRGAAITTAASIIFQNIILHVVVFRRLKVQSSGLLAWAGIGMRKT